MADIEKNSAPVDAVAKNSKKDKKKAPKSDKPGLGARIAKFFRGLWSESKKVVWFGWKQTLKSSGLVLVSLVVASAVISLVDLGLSQFIIWLGGLV